MLKAFACKIYEIVFSFNFLDIFAHVHFFDSKYIYILIEKKILFLVNCVYKAIVFCCCIQI